MGFFKNLVNKITGGGAKVYLDFAEPSLDEPFGVKVTATVSDSDLKIDKVYLKIRSTERVIVRDFDIERDGRMHVEDVHGSTILHQSEIVLAGPQTLKADETYEWEGQITLPPSALPTYLGHNAWHEWEFFAGLDAAGNDPDSGWVKVEIY